MCVCLTGTPIPGNPALAAHCDHEALGLLFCKHGLFTPLLFWWDRSIARELYGLPGATPGVDDSAMVEADNAPANYLQLLQGLMEQVRLLRTMEPKT